MLASTSHQASAVARLAALTLPGRVRFGSAVVEPLRRVPSGLTPLDALLDGGLPRGRVSEVVGAPSSGKTALVYAWLAAATQGGEVVACVDLVDAVHPVSVAAAGVDLRRMLWVRPPSLRDGLRCTEVLLQAGGFAVVVLDLGATLPRSLRRHVWPRLQRVAERSHTALVVLAPQPVAGSFAGVSLAVRQRAPRWQRGLWPLFDGFESAVCLERNKLGAPGCSARLQVTANVFPPP